MSSFAAVDDLPALAAGGAGSVKTTSNTPPRKVIVGTVIQSFWETYPGLRARLDQLAGLVDQMANSFVEALQICMDRQLQKATVEVAAVPEVIL